MVVPQSRLARPDPSLSDLSHGRHLAAPDPTSDQCQPSLGRQQRVHFAPSLPRRSGPIWTWLVCKSCHLHRQPARSRKYLGPHLDVERQRPWLTVASAFTGRLASDRPPLSRLSRSYYFGRVPPASSHASRSLGTARRFSLSRTCRHPFPSVSASVYPLSSLFKMSPII